MTDNTFKPIGVPCRRPGRINRRDDLAMQVAAASQAFTRAGDVLKGMTEVDSASLRYMRAVQTFNTLKSLFAEAVQRYLNEFGEDGSPLSKALLEARNK